jgi:uncharacterized protein (DUF4415 family)
MNAKKHASAHTFKSDLERVDAHQLKVSEYDDLPDLTDEMLVRATVNKGGRPKLNAPKVLLSVRYSQEVVAYFRATGDGWQNRMDKVLSQYVSEHPLTSSPLPTDT